MYVSNSYTYMNEILGEKLRDIYSPVVLVCFGLAGISVNLISIKVDHFSFYIYCSLISIAVTFPFYFYIVESPFYLYKQKKIKQLFKTLLKISQRNHSKDEFYSVKFNLQSKLKYGKYFEMMHVSEDVQHLNSFNQMTQSNSGFHSFRVMSMSMNYSLDLSKESISDFNSSVTKQHFWTFLKMLFIFIQIEGVFCMSIIVNKRLGISNVHISGLLINIFQIAGFMTGFWFAPRFGRRIINIVSAVLLCVFSLSLLGLDLLSNHYISYFHRIRLVRVAETGFSNKFLLF